MMYFGGVAGYLILVFVGDLVGRKMLLVACIITAAIGFLITVLSQTLIMAGIGLMISIMGAQDAFNVCFYFLS